MKNKKIYQTLEDRGNVDEIEDNGPFFCNWRNSWLGDGYYFWDTFKENAHWWGKVHRKDNYIICEAIVDFNTENCFDLVGNTDHLMDFGVSIEFMKEIGVLNKNTTVSRVIKFMQENNLFTYSAIRAFGINSKSKNFHPNYRVILESNSNQRSQYLSYKPEIQICIVRSQLDKLNFREYKVIYPDIYNPDYAV